MTWVVGDPATGQLGWMFFRNEESLAFPLGWAASLGYPLGEPIAYLDSMPLVALLFWPFRHSLPETFQYLGLWFALSSVLQFYFGYRVSRHLTNNDTLSSVIGGLLFMMAPPFAWRALGHFALASHWLIVAALEFYLATSARISRPRMAGGLAICFVAGGINPYITLLVLMLVGAGYLRSILLAARDGETSSAVKISTIGTVASVSAAAVAMWAFGFIIVGGDAKAYAGGGYGYYSMNLLAPIDPFEYPALLLKKQPSFPGQYEGYNYLGLGAIVLLAAAIVRSPRAVGRYFLSNDAVFARIVVIVSTLLALSLKMTAAEKVFFDMAPPPFIYDLLSAFRASGRLFWAAFYVILAATIGAAFIAFGKRTMLVLTVALLIQSADVRGLYNSIHSHRSQLSANDLTKSAVWQTMARAHKNLVVIRPWQCDGNKTPGGYDAYWIFGRLAAENKMTINSFYAGRTTPKQIDFFCAEQPAQIIRDGLSADTAYVLSDEFLTPSLKLRGHFCRRVDGVILCSTELGKEGFDKGVLEKAKP
ncbi:MAG: DUF6311 domain-containing protein [Afipia sp.]